VFACMIMKVIINLRLAMTRHTKNSFPTLGLVAAFAFCFLACGEDNPPSDNTDGGSLTPLDGGSMGADGAAADAGVPPSAYVFDSRLTPGISSVVHTGQTARQVLIVALKEEFKNISEGVLTGSLPAAGLDTPQKVASFLKTYFDVGTNQLSGVPIPALTDAPDVTCQATWEQLSPDANLRSKLAGNDSSTDHKNWNGDAAQSIPPAWVGWKSSTGLVVPAGGTVETPTGLVEALIETFAAQVSACVLDVNQCPKDPDNNPLPLYVTPTGLDLQQLADKTLRTGIFFSQMADDYLDDEPEDTGKGLFLTNDGPRGQGAPDTPLEHAWDEGYGYFGSAVNLLDSTLAAVKDKGYANFDSNACIDLGTEYNFHIAVSGAKRDTASGTMTTFTQDAFTALVEGRHLIASAGGDLSAAQLASLTARRDEVIENVEKIYGASVIHYINETIADMAACGTAAYSFANHAKHWGEMKAFAFAFQYNRRSPFNTPEHDFVQLHAAMGDAPVLCAGDVAAYQNQLLAARAAIASAFAFAAADVEAW